MRRGGEGRQHCTFLLPKQPKGAALLWGLLPLTFQGDSVCDEQSFRMEYYSAAELGRDGVVCPGQEHEPCLTRLDNDWAGEKREFKRIQALKRQLVQKTIKVSSNPEVLQFYIYE